VDLPNGGLTYLIGNVFQKGPRTESPTMIAYGAEGLTNPVNELHLAHNAMVNDRRPRPILDWFRRPWFVRVWGTPGRIQIIDNLFVGRGRILNRGGELGHNIVTREPALYDPALWVGWKTDQTREHLRAIGAEQTR